MATIVSLIIVDKYIVIIINLEICLYLIPRIKCNLERITLWRLL